VLRQAHPAVGQWAQLAQRVATTQTAGVIYLSVTPRHPIAGASARQKPEPHRPPGVAGPVQHLDTGRSSDVAKASLGLLGGFQAETHGQMLARTVRFSSRIRASSRL
jgi:hypothetical protein